MAISQISVFIRNNPGHLDRILQSFVAENINIRGLSASDTGDFGVTRFVVDNPETALEVLKGLNVPAVISEVLVVHLPDYPGELARVVKLLADHNINLNYCYSLISTFIAFSVDDLGQAQAILDGAGIESVTQEQLSCVQ